MYFHVYLIYRFTRTFTDHSSVITRCWVFELQNGQSSLKSPQTIAAQSFAPASFLSTHSSSSQAAYRLRRAFSFHCKTHRALILLLLASKPNPLPLSFGLVLPLRGAFIAHMKISVLTALYTSEQSQLCSGVFMSAAKRRHPPTPLSPERPPPHISVSRPLSARLSSRIQRKLYSYLLYCPADGHGPVSAPLFSKKSHVSKNHSFLWPDPGDSAPPPRYFVMILT